jgi:hypothetical protein
LTDSRQHNIVFNKNPFLTHIVSPVLVSTTETPASFALDLIALLLLIAPWQAFNSFLNGLI